MNASFPRELQRQFEGAIAEGKYARGETLTASDLAGRFQAPPDQVMLVLLAAYRKGLVDRVEQAEHTFRVLGLVQHGMDSVFTHTAKAGFKPASLVRLVEVEPATPTVAEKLAVEPGSPVYRYVRTRFVNKQPLANQTNYIPYEICPGLEGDDVSRYSFQKLLEEKYLTIFTEMKEHFEMIPVNEEDREILNLPQASSVLLIERIALCATGWPVVWANIRIRPDRYQYVAALWPQAAHLLEHK